MQSSHQYIYASVLYMTFTYHHRERWRLRFDRCNLWPRLPWPEGQSAQSTPVLLVWWDPNFPETKLQMDMYKIQQSKENGFNFIKYCAGCIGGNFPEMKLWLIYTYTRVVRLKQYCLKFINSCARCNGFYTIHFFQCQKWVERRCFWKKKTPLLF